MRHKKLFWVSLFALMFAFVEAAVVVYLRRLYGIHDLMRDVAAFDPSIAGIELGREAATLGMLVAMGWSVGRTWQARLGYTFFAFGLWDLAYYLWLKLLIGWPDSILTWDVLFLIPLPWWGPVLSPALIAGLTVFGGALAVEYDNRGLEIRPLPMEWAALGIGMLVVLYVFMSDALAALPANAQVLVALRPTAFKWPLYLVGLALMTVPMARALWRARRKR